MVLSERRVIAINGISFESIINFYLVVGDFNRLDIYYKNVFTASMRASFYFA